eukprot:gene27625-22860_t
MLSLVLLHLSISGNTYENLAGCCRVSDGDEGVFTFFKEETVSNAECLAACDAAPGCVAFENSPTSFCELHTAAIQFADPSCSTADTDCARVVVPPTAAPVTTAPAPTPDSPVFEYYDLGGFGAVGDETMRATVSEKP